MHKPLPLRPSLKARETLPSYLSRFASMNGVSPIDFASDIGFSFRRALKFDDAALDRLAVLGGLENSAIEAMVSWTGRPIGDVRMMFRGEVFVSRAVRNPVMRGCPVCLREDAGAASGDPLNVMAMRGDWLLRETSLCCRHHHPLVPLWRNNKPSQRFDIASNLRPLVDGLMKGEFDQPGREPSPYDLWLDQRLETGADETGLARYDLYAATTICGLLGAELLRDEMNVDEEGARAKAQAAGFAVLDQGEEALRCTFRSMVERTTGSQSAPAQAFGKLYRSFVWGLLREEGFDPFRQILRECILETWPFAEGQDVLGEPVAERRLHTLRTASIETGLRPALIKAFLVDAGALPENDDRPPARRTFDAVRYADLLAELPTLVGPKKMRAAIGATLGQLKALREDGILLPRTERPEVKRPWRISDGLALLDELTALSVVLLQGEDAAWEPIQKAVVRRRLRVGAIIGAVREGALRLARDPEVFGYRSFLVEKAAIDQICKDVVLPPGMTAAAFGRSIGMRDKGCFLALIAAGHTPAGTVPHAGTGKPVPFVTPGDIAAFRRRFVTSSMMEREFGLHRQTCLARLRAAGVTPFSPDGQDYGFLYERQDVEKVLRPFDS